MFHSEGVDAPRPQTGETTVVDVGDAALVVPQGHCEIGKLAAADVEHLEPTPRRPLRESPQDRRVPRPVARVILRLLLPAVRGHQLAEGSVEG